MSGPFDLLPQFQQANPGFGTPPVSPAPGAMVTRAASLKVQPAGGKLLDYIYHDSIEWFEQLYRKLPTTGMYSASPQSPVTIEVGSFRVPQSMVFVLLDYYFDIYRFSGAVVGEFVPIENRRLSTQVTWDITLPSGRRPANMLFQIVPQDPSVASQEYAPTITGGNMRTGLTPASDFMFTQAAALQQQMAGGAALSSLPQRHHRDGLMQLNQNYVARASDTVAVKLTVRDALPIPIGFFEANICGLLLPQLVFEKYQVSGKPTPIEGGV